MEEQFSNILKHLKQHRGLLFKIVAFDRFPKVFLRISDNLREVLWLEACIFLGDYEP
jgi:hypothetical protein